MVKTFVFMGRPGSGKGKQSELLATRLDAKIFSSGARCREIALENTALGRRVKSIIDPGNLTPDWFAAYIFEEVILGLREDENIIFEGAARRLGEAELFQEVATFLDRDYRVIYIDTSEETIRERVAKRAGIEGRVDDSYLEQRFKNFYELTMPSIDYFRSLGKVIEVNGEPAPEVVAEEVWQKVSN